MIPLKVKLVLECPSVAELLPIILGASIEIVAPTGQYNPTKLMNCVINRWAFNPELGYSERWGHWVLDGYGGVWLYTTNPAYFALATAGEAAPSSNIAEYRGRMAMPESMEGAALSAELLADREQGVAPDVARRDWRTFQVREPHAIGEGCALFPRSPTGSWGQTRNKTFK
jgi:hypothetical protein